MVNTAYFLVLLYSLIIVLIEMAIILLPWLGIFGDWVKGEC